VYSHETSLAYPRAVHTYVIPRTMQVVAYRIKNWLICIHMGKRTQLRISIAANNCFFFCDYRLES
jgi:hypothetical protein